VPDSVFLGQDNIRRLDGEGASLGHCISSVDSQITYCLLQLICIRVDPRQLAFELSDDAYIVTQHPVQHGHRLSHDIVNVYDLGLQYLARAEGQLEQKGDYVQAIPELRKAVDLSHGTPLMVSALAHAYGRSGNRLEAEKLLAQLKTTSTTQYVSPYYFAIVSVGLGKNDEALDLLEKAFGDRSNGLVFLQVEPELDELRSNARFVAC
jgi:tetratricopeptide (TPR) repeat protein